jgi:hypothetical protein
MPADLSKFHKNVFNGFRVVSDGLTDKKFPFRTREKLYALCNLTMLYELQS